MQALLRNAAKSALQHVCFREYFVWRLPSARNAVALTFDDGPHPTYTDAVLDMLADAGVRATFFLVGRDVERHPQVARRIVAEGHAVGGHSYDHTVITGQSPAQLAADLRRCRGVIADATGRDTVLFRPPKGEVNFASIRRVCGLGYRLVHWSATFSDYLQDGTAPLLARIERNGVRAGDILLFHDHNPWTVEALAVMIPAWKQRGLQFATV
jgi:peptidoglycan/xylan/chitin deacetylase (PgdA/CDA1 family)